MTKKQYILLLIGVLGVILSIIFLLTESSLLHQIGITLVVSAGILLIENLSSINYKYFSQNLHIFFFCRRKYIRISVAYLFKIKIDNKYLLIRGHRLPHQFQPVGGAYKYYQLPIELNKNQNILTDNMMPIDDSSVSDLRIRIKGKIYSRFWRWFYSYSNREISPWREFYEELVKSNIVDHNIFPYIAYNIVHEHRLYNKYSSYANGPEVIHAVIHELIMNDIQLNFFNSLIQTNTDKDDYYWATEDEILRTGIIPQKKYDKIFSETSKWIL